MLLRFQPLIYDYGLFSKKRDVFEIMTSVEVKMRKKCAMPDLRVHSLTYSQWFVDPLATMSGCLFFKRQKVI